jgi:hypothetical protein
MNRSLFLLGVVLCLIAGLQSCKDDNIPENLSFEQFKYVYLSAAKDGLKSITVLEKDTTLLFGGIKYGGTTNFGQSIEAIIDGDLSLVDTYNAANNTSYLPLPANCFALDKTALNIESGKSYSNVAYLTIKGALLEPEVQYLLPVTVKSLSAPDGLPLNEEMKTAWWVITSSKVVPNPAKSLWTIDSSSSFWAEGWEASYIIDGDRNKPWHTAVPGTGMPQWVIIDFSAPATIKGILYTPRQGGPNDVGGRPKHITFEVSDDKTSWTQLLDVADLNSGQDDQLLDAPAPQKGRYLRITIVSNASGGGYTYIGEIDIY